MAVTIGALKTGVRKRYINRPPNTGWLNGQCPHVGRCPSPILLHYKYDIGFKDDPGALRHSPGDSCFFTGSIDTNTSQQLILGDCFGEGITDTYAGKLGPKEGNDRGGLFSDVRHGHFNVIHVDGDKSSPSTVNTTQPWTRALKYMGRLLVDPC